MLGHCFGDPNSHKQIVKTNRSGLAKPDTGPAQPDEVLQKYFYKTNEMLAFWEIGKVIQLVITTS